MTRGAVAEAPALALTWLEVEQRARRCVYLQAAVDRVAAGELTREEALTWAALALSIHVQNLATPRW